MGDILAKLVDYLHHLTPVRVVRPWERAVYLVGGRYWLTVGPGLKLVIPGLCEVRRVSVVPEVYVTPLLTVTLRDAATVAFSASVMVEVADAAKAYLEIGNYRETVVEIAAAVLAECMGDADPVRLDPARGKRERLLEEWREELNGQLMPFGLLVRSVRLANYVRGVRTYRLLTDPAAVQSAVPMAT
jgi:regulator of protease activity HflC (stomatin/prohibitin superfamily)